MATALEEVSITRLQRQGFVRGVGVQCRESQGQATKEYNSMVMEVKFFCALITRSSINKKLPLVARMQYSF